jgi:hypothetical protein
VDHALVRQGTEVTVESRTTNLADAPKEDGYCVVKPAASRTEAANLPCSSRQTFSATKISSLP